MRTTYLFALPLAALAVPSATAQAPASITVQLSNYEFTPKTIILEHGKPYVLRLTNASGGDHDFTAPAFFAAANVASEDRHMVTEGEVELPSGMTHEIHLTAPAVPGRYKVKYTHTFHKFFGMSGTIIVR